MKNISSHYRISKSRKKVIMFVERQVEEKNLKSIEIVRRHKQERI